MNSKNEIFIYYYIIIFILDSLILPDECGRNKTMNTLIEYIDYYYHCSSQSWALYKFILFKFKIFFILYINI